MVIVKLQGGLGNQMFQYALAKQLQAKGKQVKIDNSQLVYNNNINELGIFSIDLEEALPEEVTKYGDCNKSIWHKILRHTIGYKKSHYVEGSMAFQQKIFEVDEKYLDGYWQTEKYFSSIEDIIRKIYSFPKDNEERNIKIKQIMRNTNSVSVHIRRGDYLSPEVLKLYGNPCNVEYYTKAMEYFRKRYPNVQFFVFTNDVEWVKEKFQNYDNITFIDWNQGTNSFRDMELMSYCKHNIIANSSFSWWAAWLNKNPEKKVVAPKIWFEHIPTPDIECQNWVRM